jgi:hypothetical protein
VPPEYYVIARAGSESDVASSARSTEHAQFSFCRKRLASSSTRQMATNMHMRLRNVGQFDGAVASAAASTDRVQFRNEERTVYRFTIVFSNKSPNGQLPIDEQLAIALYRFGHDGNAASLQHVANWAGVGKGTVTLVTRCVMTAVLHPSFMSNAVRFPT